MIPSSGRLLTFIVFIEVVGCWSCAIYPSPAGDSALLRSAPFSFFVRRLQAREFFSVLSFRLALPRWCLIIFFINVVGPLVWTVYSDVLLLSAVVAVSGFTLAFALALAFFLASFVLVAVPIGFAALGALLASILSSTNSSATRPFIGSFSTMPHSLIRLIPCLPVPLPALYPFHAIAHTSSFTRSLLVSESLCVDFVSCPLTFPKSIGTGPSWAIISLMMISSFSMISSNFFRSREHPFDVLRHHFPHHEYLLCFINRFELMLVLNHFQWQCCQPVYQFLFIFALLGRRKYGLQRYNWIIWWLGRVTVNHCLPRHEPTTRLRLSDLEDYGSCRAFRCIGQCHRQIKVQFNVLVVCSMTTVSPRLSCPESPFRDLLGQLPSLMLRIDKAQPRSDLSCEPSTWCAARPVHRVELLSVLQSKSTRCLVRLVARTPSPVAIEMPSLPILPLCVGNSSARCWGGHTSRDPSVMTWIQLRTLRYHNGWNSDNCFALESWAWSHKSVASHWEHVHSWAPHCARKGNQEVAGVEHSARLCAVSQHFPSGTCTTLIKHFISQQNLCRLRQLTNITRPTSFSSCPHAHASSYRQIVRIPWVPSREHVISLSSADSSSGSCRSPRIRSPWSSWAAQSSVLSEVSSSSRQGLLS